MAGPSPSPESKQPLTIVTSSFQEFTPEAPPSPPRSTLLQHANTALTAISAVFGLIIMATAADTLSVYHSTHLGSEFHLPVWPQSFDIKPTIAGVVCGVLIFVMNSVALVGQLVPAFRRNPLSLLTKLITILPLAIALIAAIVGTVMPLNALTSSTSWSVQSWSCQWSNINTSTAPHWGTLCSESKAAGIMSVCVIPLDALIIASMLASMVMGGQGTGGVARGQWERKGSQGDKL
ncbi:hypothetical protein SBOR_5900 [Sclerotinia borealis F-4128]|uniref:Uncharacterized protein n=1 Tax=Sclerotinia borealis (strain F-4128) TaxID=1432307 RepID=W9CGP8_SCLBF|nr:hypothetical protein SBOR_5900 [Sclerotinia borealis F-4128]